MPLVVTLTMNPAVDLSTSTARVEPVRKLRCRSPRRDPGGGGVNVARVIHRFGVPTLALYPAGGLVGGRLGELLEGELVQAHAIPICGETREDFTVFDEHSGEQYRFFLPGPHLRSAEWLACLGALANLDARPEVICASGGLPPGVPDDFYARLAEIAANLGARFVLDTSGAPLRAALETRVDLIKPNLRELRELSGAALDNDDALIATCRALIEHRRVGAVALTMGAEGAILVTAREAWRAAALPVRPVSSAGAGDSFLGAMVWAMVTGRSDLEAFRYGVAGGASAVSASGAELCHPKDVHRLVKDVEVLTMNLPRPAA
jgi:6-phosphofructokinase 2